MAENAARLTVRVDQLVDQHAPTGLATFAIDRALVCELNALAMAGDSDAGIVRTADNQVGRAVVVFQPPPWQEVEGHLADTFAYLAAKRAADGVHLAAYAMWRVCWIHPFGDGNGRTARALAYAILCIGYGRRLPGVPTVPEQISMNKYPYWDALQAADKAWAAGKLDVSKLEELLSDLVETQIAGTR